MAAKNLICPSAYFMATKVAGNPELLQKLARIQKEYQIYEYFADLKPTHLHDEHWEKMLFTISKASNRLNYMRGTATNQFSMEIGYFDCLEDQEECDKKKYEEGGMGYGPSLYSLYKEEPHRDDGICILAPKIVFDLQYVAQYDQHDMKFGIIFKKHFIDALNLNYKLPRSFPVEVVNADLDHPRIAQFLDSLSLSGSYKKDLEHDYPNIICHPVIHKDNPYRYSSSSNDPSEKVVYMSKYAEEIIDGPLVAGAYIFPVIPDLNNETASVSREGNYQVMRLPIDRYLRWDKGYKLLHLDEMLGTFSDVASGDSWRDALYRHVPPDRLEYSPYETVYDKHRRTCFKDQLKVMKNIQLKVSEAFGEMPDFRNFKKSPKSNYAYVTSSFTRKY